jgi:phosphate transport system permease protein
MEAAGPYDRAKALSAFQARRRHLLLDHPRLRDLGVGAAHSRRHHPLADRRRVAGDQEFGFSFLFTNAGRPVDRGSRRARADLRHAGHLGHRDADRHSGRPRIAIFLTELCPQWLRRPIGIAIELLAGIPSIIYGMWGLFVLGRSCRHVQPFMIRCSTACRCSARSFAGPPSYLGLFNAGADPRDHGAAVHHRDLGRRVRDGAAGAEGSAYGVGCTTWEVVRNVVMPYTRVGVIGGIMLALGRALGETMAVTFVIGNAHRSRPRCSRRAPRSRRRSPTNSPRRRRLHTSGADPARPAPVRAHLHRAGRARLMLMRLEKKAGN